MRLIAVAGAAAVLAPAAHASTKVPAAFPAAGPVLVPNLTVRAAPSPHARVVTVIHQFRPDFREQYVLAVGSRKGKDGRTWVELRVQLRPNGTLGWVPLSAVQLAPTHYRIVVHLGLRQIDLYRDGKQIAAAPVAIGAPGRETPVGQYYVTARFVPDDPFLGVFAVETSAYSKLTEWPGGGVVGIHGTSAPQLIGQAVSHGCVRVTNATAELLRRYAPLGTPIAIVAD